MPQWRKLHVKSVDSHDINGMPDDFTRLLWLLMPLGLDSQGRAIDDAGWIKAKLMPLRRDVSLEQVEQSMAWYSARCMIERYEVNGRHYFHVPTFAKYQGKTDREAASVIPAPVLRKTKKGPAQVVTNSGPTQELGVSRSVTDVDSDSDAEEKTHAPQNPARTRAGENEPSQVVETGQDPVKDLAALFTRVAGVPLESLPQKNQGTQFWDPLRRMIKLADGRAGDLLRQAVAQMRRDGLTIKSPGSVLGVFVSLHGAAETGANKSSAREVA